MKKILLGTVALIALGIAAPASAADLGVRTSTKVRSRRGSGDAQRDESDRTQQDLLHGILSGFLFASLGPEALINSEGRAPPDLISNAHHTPIQGKQCHPTATLERKV